MDSKNETKKLCCFSLWCRMALPIFNDIRRFETKVCRFIQLIAKEKPDERGLLYLFDIKAIN